MTDGPPEPDPNCWSCLDYGYIETFHPSTDARMGSLPCPDLNDPKRHPPATPVPLQVTTVPGHGPDCDGTCDYKYPDGCPPF